MPEASLVRRPREYVYVWKSDKAWAGTCRRLDVTFVDGTQHIASFKFTR